VTAANSTRGVEEPRSLVVEEPCSPRPRVRDWRSDAATEWGGLNSVVLIVRSWLLLAVSAASRCGRSSRAGPPLRGQRFASPCLDDAYLRLSSSSRQNRCCIWVSRWRRFLIRKTLQATYFAFAFSCWSRSKSSFPCFSFYYNDT
jgi:hypothetical protein